MERRKRFNVFANVSNVSAVPSVTLGTAETFERLRETVKRLSRSNAVPRVMLGTAETF